MPRISEFDSKIEFDSNFWAITFINTSGKWGGHAKIIIEGIKKDSSLYVVECHAIAQPGTMGKNISKLPQLFNNSQGLLQPIITESEKYVDEKKLEYYKNATRRTILVPKKNAKDLINEVKKQVADNKNGIYQPFQYGGIYRLAIFGGNGGHNCTTWAEEVLEKANIEGRKMLLDILKAMPEKHAKRCLIM